MANNVQVTIVIPVYNEEQANTNVTLNLSSVSPGIYILQVSKGLKTVRQKFIKQ